MLSKQRLALLAAGVALASCSLWLAQAGRADTSVGKIIADFTLNDQHGKAVALADLKGAKATVVVFVGTECPINNQYMLRLCELHAQWAPKGVRFLALNANDLDTVERIREHAKKNELPFPVLRDEGGTMADRFGATRTPEAFVLDVGCKVCYQGRIDDQFGIGYLRAKPTQNHVADALAAVLDGKAVAVTAAAVEGCKIARAVNVKDGGTVTYSKHISRILQNNCQECHRPGMIGPMPLLTYENARSWAGTIQEVIEDGRMPPWPADPKHGKWANDRSLSPADRKAVLDWIAQGTPRGEDKDLPAPRKFVDGWKIGQPDVVLKMPKAFHVPAATPPGGVPYQNYTIETNFTEDKWIQAAEAKPGAPEVVHHVLVFVVAPGENFRPGQGAMEVLSGSAPGDTNRQAGQIPGYARFLPKGSKLVFQMHYTPNGRAQSDQSSIGLVFAKKPPTHRVVTSTISNRSFRIPPGADHHPVEAKRVSTEDCLIVGFMPHMHLRGKDFKYTLEYPDGKKEILLNVPRFDFNWQQGYLPIQPVVFPKGATLHCEAHFDNSKKNLSNPDPTKTVTWGSQTWEEMMIGWVDFAYPVAQKGQ